MLTYLWLKTAHIVSIVAWMAGLLYLPRLFYYHALHMDKPEMSEIFALMERRLYHIIMRPALIFTYVTGIALIMTTSEWMAGWFHTKILFVILLTGFHGFCGRWRRQLAQHHAPFQPNVFRALNEVPTICLIIIVICVVVRPF